MLQTPQLYPRAGSQEYPSPAAEAEADGSTVVYFSPDPARRRRRRATGSRPTRRRAGSSSCACYSPLQPFFDKTWRPGEIEPVG